MYYSVHNKGNNAQIALRARRSSTRQLTICLHLSPFCFLFVSAIWPRFSFNLAKDTAHHNPQKGCEREPMHRNAPFCTTRRVASRKTTRRFGQYNALYRAFPPVVFPHFQRQFAPLFLTLYFQQPVSQSVIFRQNSHIRKQLPRGSRISK